MTSCARCGSADLRPVRSGLEDDAPLDMLRCEACGTNTAAPPRRPARAAPLYEVHKGVGVSRLAEHLGEGDGELVAILPDTREDTQHGFYVTVWRVR